MVDQFLTFLASRRAKILKTKQKLEDELALLDRTERLYRTSGAGPDLSIQEEDGQLMLVEAKAAQPAVRVATPLNSEGTIQDRIRALLGEAPQGLTSQQILTYLRARGLPKLARTSLSPQLSRMRKDRHVDLDSGLWKLRKTEAGSDPKSPPASNSPA